MGDGSNKVEKELVKLGIEIFTNPSDIGFGKSAILV